VAREQVVVLVRAVRKAIREIQKLAKRKSLTHQSGTSHDEKVLATITTTESISCSESC
jgi:hypothetical protein